MRPTFSKLAAIFGIAAACTPADDANAVRAREVGAWSDAAPVAPTADAPDASDAAAVVVVVEAGSAGEVADAGAAADRVGPTDAAPAAPTADLPHVAHFMSIASSSAPPKPCQGLGCNDPHAACGATSSHRTPTADAQVGLAPRPELSDEEKRRAAATVAQLQAHFLSCLVVALKIDPMIDVPATLTVEVRAPGHRARPIVTVSPASFMTSARTCIERSVANAMGGDEPPVKLKFPVRVVVQGR